MKMSSHFDCIGLQVTDEGSFARILDVIIGKATEDVPTQEPFRNLRWTDPSGASVAFHLREDHEGSAIECVTPFFEPQGGLSRWRVRTSFPAMDPECVHCSGIDCDILDEEGEMVTRAAIQLLNFLPYQEWLNELHEFELEVAAFAYEAAFYANQDEFDEGQRRWLSWSEEDWPKMPDGNPVRFSDTVFLPEGMFADASVSMTERATALYAGRVKSAQHLTNTATGGEFQHVRVNTPSAVEGEPIPGKIAFIRAWLVGRPMIPPPGTR
jgi:hypothetical protein